MCHIRPFGLGSKGLLGCWGQRWRALPGALWGKAGPLQAASFTFNACRFRDAAVFSKACCSCSSLIRRSCLAMTDTKLPWRCAEAGSLQAQRGHHLTPTCPSRGQGGSALPSGSGVLIYSPFSLRYRMQNSRTALAVSSDVGHFAGSIGFSPRCSVSNPVSPAKGVRSVILL